MATFLGLETHHVHEIAAVYDTCFSTAIIKNFDSKLTAESTPLRLHRDQLPPEPKSWKAMMQGSYHSQWLQAANEEVQRLLGMNAFIAALTKDAEAEKVNITPLTWVFKYKFDSDGFLLKFKARLCVRGDLQAQWGDTYAATLAARIFRAMIAIAAAFDLEIVGFDAINAFLNAKLKNRVYCRCPEGFPHLGECLLLLRALYGLKEAPLLWYEELSSFLAEELYLTPVPDAPCLYSNEHLVVFFYVDDIVVMCKKQDKHKLHEFKRQLSKKYDVRCLGDLQSFLGVRIVRDREQRKIWLLLDSYINKVVKKYGLEPVNGKYPDTPLSQEELLPSTDEQDPERTKIYQELVGSLAFISNMCRPDVSKPHSILSQFLINPGPKHLSESIRCWRYLAKTATLALEASGDPTQLYGAHVHDPSSDEIQYEPEFVAASDAAFADHSLTRRSSQGFLFKLFGMSVDWKASLQRTVTKSTTEAELMALSAAASELAWWKRFFKGIGYEPEEEPILLCDNMQTVSAVTKQAERLNTKLKHVDIHNHWIRQEIQAGNLIVQWQSTNSMPADGLTKSLPRQKHQVFVQQLGLVDIRERLHGKAYSLNTNPELSNDLYNTI
jgi:hypothetical protein